MDEMTKYQLKIAVLLMAITVIGCSVVSAIYESNGFQPETHKMVSKTHIISKGVQS